MQKSVIKSSALYVSLSLSLSHSLSPYLMQTAVWVTDPEEVYIKGTIKNDMGDKVEVETAKNTVVTVPKAEAWERNPPKFEKVHLSKGFCSYVDQSFEEF